MKTQTTALQIPLNGFMSTSTIARTVLSFTLFALMILAQSCSKDSISDSGTPGPVDSRLMGNWQFQEILGSGSVTQTSVFEISFFTDGSGFEDTYSIGPFGQTGRERTFFTWTSISSNKIHMKFPSGEGDVGVTISDGGNVMRLTYASGSHTTYSRMN
jgi:hypothetical protein